jgi:two-component system, NarL family, nitrate/nitrite response regulator NarL
MKVFLIDDHTLFRTGLGALLKSNDIQVAAAETIGPEIIPIIKELEPDIILLDLNMPNMNGFDILNLIKSKDIKTPVSILTTSEDENDLSSCLKAGAQGYLLKTMQPNELVKALHTIIEGDVVVDPSLTTILARMAQGKVPQKNKKNLEELLTPREYEILGHLAEGQSNKIIARNLGISDGTVKLHVKAILRKLNIQSRVEAAVLAVEQGVKKPNKGEN